MTRLIDGDVAAGFEPVADAFLLSVRDQHRGGAACAVYVGGEKLVDIWTASTSGFPWARDTRQVVFSVSKGITAVCLLMAVDDGRLRLDDLVVRHWPEFAEHGKDGLTVGDMLAHRGGLPVAAEPLTAADVRAWHPVAASLARQAPMWKPGSQFAYHPLTMGWLAGEVLRRATGSRPSEWLRDRIAAPLGLNLAYGAKTSDAIAAIEPAPADTAAAPPNVDADLVWRAMTMHGAFHGVDLFDIANSDDFLSAEVPAVNLVASAGDLARLYAATVGNVDGVRLVSEETLLAAIQPRSSGTPFIGIDEGLRWGAGLMLDGPARPMAGPGSFGHDGAGGQLAFANHRLDASFAFQTTQPGGVVDDRANKLSAALQRCL